MSDRVIHEENGKWYFWEETWSYRQGPFESRERAEGELESYIENFLETDTLTAHEADCIIARSRNFKSIRLSPNRLARICKSAMKAQAKYSEACSDGSVADIDSAEKELDKWNSIFNELLGKRK